MSISIKNGIDNMYLDIVFMINHFLFLKNKVEEFSAFKKKIKNFCFQIMLKTKFSLNVLNPASLKSLFLLIFELIYCNN